MPAQHLCLVVLGVADGVHAELAKEQGFLLGQVLQAREIALEIRLAMEVNVESGEVRVLAEADTQWEDNSRKKKARYHLPRDRC